MLVQSFLFLQYLFKCAREFNATATRTPPLFSLLRYPCIHHLFLLFFRTDAHCSCHGDLNETFFVGNVDEGGRNVVKSAFECLAAAIDMVGLLSFSYLSLVHLAH